MTRKICVLCVFLFWAVLAARADDDDKVVPGEVVVRFVADADVAAFIARWRVEYGAEILDRIPSRPIYLIRVFEGDEEEFVDDIEFDPAVEWAEPNYTGRDTNPDPGTQSIFVASTSGAYQRQIALSIIHADPARSSATGHGVVVAVIDSGLDATHPVFLGRVEPGGWNFLIGTDDFRDIGDGLDTNGNGLIDEAVGHGTLVAGLIVRVAPEVRILPLKALDADGMTSTFRMVQAMYYAMDRGVRLMNISMGTTQETMLVDFALMDARAEGVLIVSSAGNEDTSSPVRFPSARPELGVVGVAATDDTDRRAWFSNYGEHVALSAPGVAITSTTPDGGYGRADGTSFAAPLVTGVAALYWSADPSQPASTVRNRLLQQSINIDALNPGYERELGTGRLDALLVVRGVTFQRSQP